MFPTIFSTSNVLLLSVVLFFAGLLEDLLDTWVTFTVVKRQSFLSAFITFISIFLEYTVFISIISNLDKWYVIGMYALGSGIGGFIVIEYQKRETLKKKEQQKLKRLKGYRKMKLAKLRAERLAREVASKAKKIVEKKSVVKVPTVKVPTEIEKKPEVKAVVKKNETTISTTKSSSTQPSV